MAKTLLLITLAAVLAAAETTPAPVPSCDLKGVVSHTFYGKASDVNREIRHIENQLAGSRSGRVHMLMIETASGADVYYYERSGEALTKISWSGDTVRELRSKLDNTLLDTRGRACAGAEMRKILTSLGNTRTEQLRAPTDTMASAMFVPAVAAKEAAGYIRVTMFIPC
ncbi:MAG TPA: hypothetical protein VE621_15750 [Bryobacteraceae bacterium]|jgi:hypothetical protein|nr:hypothetical protein [Bryobacteraceae bacterium]